MECFASKDAAPRQVGVAPAPLLLFPAPSPPPSHWACTHRFQLEGSCIRTRQLEAVSALLFLPTCFLFPQPYLQLQSGHRLSSPPAGSYAFAAAGEPRAGKSGSSAGTTSICPGTIMGVGRSKAFPFHGPDLVSPHARARLWAMCYQPLLFCTK